MANIITQAQYNTTQQTIRNTYLKINLLDFNYLTIDTIEGNVISGSVQINSDSDIRRTCDISIVVTNSSFDVAPGGKIWLDKLIQIYVGVIPSDKNDIEWTNLGIYLINQPSYQYDATTHTLTFQGVDLMAKLTGLRYGYLSGVTYKVPAGSNVKDVIIAILKENGFSRYVVSECYNTNETIQDVPNDMEYEMGSSWFDILSDLRDILPNYQIYFDVDGVFHYEQIPYNDNEPIMIDDNIWDENVISESVNVDFESVKNSIEVYGKTHDISNYPSEISVENSNIKLTIATITKLEEYVMIGFTLTQDVIGKITIQVNDFEKTKLVDADGIQLEELKKDEYWVARYTKNNEWEFLGHQQAFGSYKDENPNSPFYINNPSGEIKLVLYGGDYEYIFSDDLAIQRAKFEIYQRCRMNDTVDITCVPIYWADVNWMVNYTTFDTAEAKQYMIKSINTDLTYNGTQTIQMISYYPYYGEQTTIKATHKIIRYAANPSIYILVKATYTGKLLEYINKPVLSKSSASDNNVLNISLQSQANGYARGAKFPEALYHIFKYDNVKANSDESCFVIYTKSLLEYNNKIVSDDSSSSEHKNGLLKYSIYDVSDETKNISKEAVLIKKKATETSDVSKNINFKTVLLEIDSSSNSSEAKDIKGSNKLTISTNSSGISGSSIPGPVRQKITISQSSKAKYSITKNSNSSKKVSVRTIKSSPISSMDSAAVADKIKILKENAMINGVLSSPEKANYNINIGTDSCIGTSSNTITLNSKENIYLISSAKAESVDSWIYPVKDGKDLIIRQAYTINVDNNTITLE